MKTSFYYKGGSVLDLKEFLASIFGKEDTQGNLVEASEKVLKKITSKEGLHTKQSKKAQQEMGISKTTYYTILNRLEKLDLILKRDGEYQLNPNFATNIQGISAFWQTFYNRYKKRSWE